MNFELCQGCKTLNDIDDGECPFKEYNDKCPCIDCLIKSMCKCGCDEYEVFISYVNTALIEEM